MEKRAEFGRPGLREAAAAATANAVCMASDIADMLEDFWEELMATLEASVDYNKTIPSRAREALSLPAVLEE